MCMQHVKKCVLGVVYVWVSVQTQDLLWYRSGKQANCAYVSFEWREGRTSDPCGLSRLLIKLDRSKEVRSSKNYFATRNLIFYRPNFSFLSQMIHCRFCCLSRVSGDSAFRPAMNGTECCTSALVPDLHLLMCFLNYFHKWFQKISNLAYSTGFLTSLVLRSHRSEEIMMSKLRTTEKKS